jgi:hypothetical protein
MKLPVVIFVLAVLVAAENILLFFTTGERDDVYAWARSLACAATAIIFTIAAYVLWTFEFQWVH